ncbi:hypothetical protein NKW43_15450, partial [Gluconobacter albidus]|uniref:hypothetical protein n=1 Tax=Gluconobacter albidus TaxID=318683 RepID=UPI00209F13EE
MMKKRILLPALMIAGLTLSSGDHAKADPPYFMDASQAWIGAMFYNKPRGLAGLDGNGNVTAPVVSGSITLQDSYTASSGLPTATPRIKLYGGALDALAGGPDAVWMGGWALPSVSGAAGDPATSAIVNIAARPYGNYNNGCALCVIATGGTQTDSAGRAAISGTDWHEGVSANAGMGDIVGFYEHL